MRTLLAITVALLSACGPWEDIPGVNPYDRDAGYEFDEDGGQDSPVSVKTAALTAGRSITAVNSNFGNPLCNLAGTQCVCEGAGSSIGMTRIARNGVQRYLEGWGPTTWGCSSASGQATCTSHVSPNYRFQVFSCYAVRNSLLQVTGHNCTWAFTDSAFRRWSGRVGLDTCGRSQSWFDSSNQLIGQGNPAGNTLHIFY
jgi:hypothetical protein